MSRVFLTFFLAALLMQVLVFLPCWLRMDSTSTAFFWSVAFWVYFPALFLAGLLVAALGGGQGESGFLLALSISPILGGLLYSAVIGLLAMRWARRAAKKQVKP